MRKVTLEVTDYKVNQIPRAEDLSYDADGFPSPSNFTKKSKGAVVHHMGKAKKLVVRNNRLSWSTVQKGGAVATTKSNNDNLLKMMMMDKMISNKSRDKPEEPTLNSSLQKYKNHMKEIANMKWDNLNSKELEQLILVRDQLNEASQLTSKVLRSFFDNLKIDIQDFATQIYQQVQKNKNGNTYRAKLIPQRNKIKTFINEYSSLFNLCSVSNINFRASGAFCKLYTSVRNISNQIDQLAIQNDFSWINSRLIEFLNNKITLTPEQVNSLIDQNNQQINIQPANVIGTSLINRFKNIHSRIVNKETERFKNQKIQEDQNRVAQTNTKIIEEIPQQQITQTTPAATSFFEGVVELFQGVPTGKIQNNNNNGDELQKLERDYVALGRKIEEIKGKNEFPDYF